LLATCQGWKAASSAKMLREGDALRVTTASNPTAKTPKASPETHFRQASCLILICEGVFCFFFLSFFTEKKGKEFIKTF
jgi:hypothetical protein